MNGRYLAIVTRDPFRVSDIFDLEGIVYFHLNGKEIPGKENTYIASGVNENVSDRLKRLELTEAFIISEKRGEVENFVKEYCS